MSTPAALAAAIHKLGGFFVGVVFETIDQAELLNGSQSDAGQDAEVWNDGQDSAQAKPSAFGGRHLHSAVNDPVPPNRRDGNIHRVNALKAVDGHAVSGAKLQQEFVRINLHRLISMLKATPQPIFYSAP